MPRKRRWHVGATQDEHVITCACTSGCKIRLLADYHIGDKMTRRFCTRVVIVTRRNPYAPPGLATRPVKFKRCIKTTQLAAGVSVKVAGAWTVSINGKNVPASAYLVLCAADYTRPNTNGV